MFKKLIAIGAGLILALLAAAAGLTAYLSPRLQHEVAAFLTEKTGHEVELESFSWRLLPSPRFQGAGLTVADASRLEPLATAREFEISFSFSGILQKPRRLREIRFSDLEIRISRQNAPEAPNRKPSAEGSAPAASPLAVDRILIQNAFISIETADQQGGPEEFRINEIQFTEFSLDESVPYSASLSFERLKGDLQIEGRFGPWNFQHPVETPLSGAYSLREADISAIGAVEGMLNASGEFDGSVRELQIEGTADVPDFAIQDKGGPVILEVNYRIRRRDEETLLEEIVSRFSGSTLRTTGRVGPSPDAQGTQTDLKTVSDSARVEDFLLLTKGEERPAMIGDMTLDANIRIPAGSASALQGLQSEGSFQIPRGEFTSTDLQKTLEQLSRIGQRSEVDRQEGSSAFSNLSGSFRMEGSRIDFDRLAFEIPGMKLDLAGAYSFPDEQMDFRGTVAFERSLAEMAPPELGRVLDALGSILRRGESGTVIPIRIRGSRSSPSIRPDFGREGGD